MAPDYIVAYNGPNDTGTVNRPVCKYPDELVYKGHGSTNSAVNFTCKVRTTDPLLNSEQAIPDPVTSNPNPVTSNPYRVTSK